MDPEDDPLEANPDPARVSFFSGQFLQADDFRAEQTYHRGRLAIALRHLAGAGTLAGLRVGLDEHKVHVAPGLAIDPLGGLIELRTPACLDLTDWLSGEDPSLHSEALRSDPPAILADVMLWAEARPAGQAIGPNGTVPTRIVEEGRLALVSASRDAPTRAWPADDAPEEEKLEAVLASWESQGDTRLLLARITIPTDPLLPIVADNSVRPYIFLPGTRPGR